MKNIVPWIILLLQFSTIISYPTLSSQFSTPANLPSDKRRTVKPIATSADLHHKSGENSAEFSKSMIRVRNAQNKTVSVLLGTQQSLKVITIGKSTLIKASPELERKIDPNLLNLTKLIASDYIEKNRTNVIMSTSSSKAELAIQKTLATKLNRIYTGEKSSDYSQYLAGNIDYSSLFLLAKSQYVNYIWLDREFKICLDESVNIIKNVTEWTNIESAFGRQINGSGMKIAILDTGIDSGHPDFSFPNGTSKIIAATSFTGEPIGDGNGHGTHVASIAAGTGSASSGQYTGVAPGATLFNVKVLNTEGKGLESWIVDGIQWAVDNGADILSMSFGTDIIGGNGTDPVSTAVDWATQQGIVCIVAAGNYGSGMYTITNPGVTELAITVGASSKQGTIASFSSRGPTTDHRIKPDVLAPGVSITAARAKDTYMGTPVSQYYTKASGTSMATPHVSGAAALLLDVHPTWSPSVIKMALANYAKNLGSNVLEQGSGRIDVSKSATAPLISNFSISFGRVHLNTVDEHLVIFQNLANETLHPSMNVTTLFIENGDLFDVTSLNTSTLNLMIDDSKGVKLRLETNSGMPSGYFEGSVNVTFGRGSIRIPFFFCILSLLKCEIVNEGGSKIKAAFVVSDLEGKTVGYATERSSAQFILMPGEYVIQAMNIYGLTATGNIDESYAFLIHRKFSIGKDETKHMQLSLAAAYRLSVRTTDLKGMPLTLELKQLLTPFYHITYLSNIGTIPNQFLYLTNISEYMNPPGFFGFMGISQEDAQWHEFGHLTSEVDVYYIGWDISEFGISNVPDWLNYTDAELATMDIETLLPTPSRVTTIWFNQIAGLWQTGLWHGYQTNPGIKWKIHILPYQFKSHPEAGWAELEWSCIYALSTYPDTSDEYFVIDRHFQPITKGEASSYYVGRTPLTPQHVHNSTPYYGDGLFIPHYPLRAGNNLFLDKSNPQATKSVEIFKDGVLVYNQTKFWAQEPISITDFLESYGYGLYGFVIKTETSMNLSSQNYAKYEINYTDSFTDLLPPSILNLDSPPCFGSGEYTIRAKLDDDHELENVSLFYSVDGEIWTSARTEDLGNGTYSTGLNLAPVNQQISIAVEAKDASGNGIWFSTKPATRRGHVTEISATLDENKISGKLAVIDGALDQPVYLKIISAEIVRYALTDINGNFEFMVPQSMQLPIEIELVNMGPYLGANLTIGQKSHDIAIAQVTKSKTITSNIVRIYVLIVNQGYFNETFSLTTYYNTTPIATVGVILVKNGSTTVTFTWNTTSVIKSCYTITAVATIVPGETEIQDNSYTDGCVVVTISGDVDGDFDVDIYDIVTTANAYRKKEGEAQYNPNCDIDNDGDIDIFDVVFVATEYGTTY